MTDSKTEADVIPLRPASQKLQLVASTEYDLPLNGKPLNDKSRRKLMDALNSQYCVIRHAGKVMVMTFESIEHKVSGMRYKRLVPTFLSFSDFRNSLMHKTVRIPKGEDEFEDMSVGKWWLYQPDRLQFDGLVYAPGDDRRVIDNRYNLWTGWSIAPKPGDWSRLYYHIEKVLAAGDPEKFRYIINWMAWCVQNPDQRAEVAIVFQGAKGTGKGTLGGAMMRIFGPHGRHISSAYSLIGNFNSHLRDCSFLFADEALWPGDRSGEGSLKRLITEPTLSVEAKHHDAVEVPNMLHIMLASNESWIIPTSEGERRFVLFKVSPIHMQDETHFIPLYEEMNNGGLGAMLYDLLAHDLQDFHPRQLPPDTGLLDQQRESLQPLDAWICELLESGRLMGSNFKFPNRAVSNSYDREIEVDGNTRLVKQLGLFDQAKQVVPRLRTYVTDHQLGAHLRKIGAVTAKVNGGRRGWRFPPLKEMRADWEARFQGWNWSDPDLQEWQAEPEGDDGDDTPPLNESERQREQQLQALAERRRQEKEKEKEKESKYDEQKRKALPASRDERKRQAAKEKRS